MTDKLPEYLAGYIAGYGFAVQVVEEMIDGCIRGTDRTRIVEHLRHVAERKFKPHNQGNG